MIQKVRRIFAGHHTKKKASAAILFSLALFFIIALTLLFTAATSALEFDYPEPLSPRNGATGVDVISIVFSWKPFYVGTNKYDFELSKNPDMSNPEVKTSTNDGQTTYKHTGILEYNTTYYWRVMASDPLGGNWGSAVFTTRAPPSSTNNTTGSNPPQDSGSKSLLSSISDYIEKNFGWPMFGGMIAGIIIIAIVLIYVAKPKSPPPGQRQWQGGATQPPSYMPQQPINCPSCGFSNTPERKFCNNCGAGLISRGPRPPWPNPQTPTCPACGLSNPQGQKFCSRCGTGLSNPAPQQAWQPQQQPNNCPACSTPISPGRQFCNNCGTNLGIETQQQVQVYESFTCPICNAPINKGLNPCPNCGTWLEWNR
jgi:hypothetical protein